MGRKRTTDRQVILDAVERVVARDGAANLTIDAIATEAGVTKATVLYDYKSKQALVEAVVERAIRQDDMDHARAEARLEALDNRVINGHIVACSTASSKGKIAVALNICTALAPDSGLRENIYLHQVAVMEKIVETSRSPRGALLAYLALEGLKSFDRLGSHNFIDDDREKLLREISWLATETPCEKTLPHSEHKSDTD